MITSVGDNDLLDTLNKFLTVDGWYCLTETLQACVLFFKSKSVIKLK